MPIVKIRIFLLDWQSFVYNSWLKEVV